MPHVRGLTQQGDRALPDDGVPQLVPVLDLPVIQSIGSEVGASGAFPQPRLAGILGSPDDFSPSIPNLEVVRRDAEGDRQPDIVESILVRRKGRWSVEDGAVHDHFCTGR